MKRKAVALMLAVVMVILVTAGCSPISIEGNTLLRPPRATGDKAEIQDIITQQAGGKYTFKYPQTGTNRSAITMKSDKAQNEFAVALYSPNNDTKMNVSMIAYIKNEWKCIGTFSNAGAGVDRVMFSDLNNDGTDEVIIGWTGYGNTSKTLTAYSVADTAYEMTIDDTYDEMLIEDVTADALNEIVLLSLGSQKNPSSIRLLQYSEQEKKPIGKYALELDPEITSFVNVTVGNIAQNQIGLVVDGEKNGGVLTSQIIYFDAQTNTLQNPLVSKLENDVYSNPTARKDTIYSRDADGDGMIEVPVITPMSAGTDVNAANVCNITAWKQYSIYNKSLGTKLNTVINYNDRYYFTMPNRWMNGSVTAVTDPDTRQMTFYLWNSKTSSFGDKLLTIRRYTEEEWEQEDTADMIALSNIDGTKSHAVFGGQIFITHADETLNITPEEVTASAHSFWTN